MIPSPGFGINLADKLRLAPNPVSITETSKMIILPMIVPQKFGSAERLNSGIFMSKMFINRVSKKLTAICKISAGIDLNCFVSI